MPSSPRSSRWSRRLAEGKGFDRDRLSTDTTRARAYGTQDDGERRRSGGKPPVRQRQTQGDLGTQSHGARASFELAGLPKTEAAMHARMRAVALRGDVILRLAVLLAIATAAGASLRGF